MLTSNPHAEPINPIPIPVARQTQTNLFVAFSVKANKLLQFESAWEYRFFLLCESDPDILRLCSQPYKIDVNINGHKLRYTFDMWLLWKDGYREYIEVKPEDDCILTDNGHLIPPKWPLIEAWSKSHTPEVNIRHVSDLFINKRSQVIKAWDEILPFVARAKEQNRFDLQSHIEIKLKHEEKCTLQTLVRSFDDEEEDDVLAVCFNLLHQGKCYADLATQSLDKKLVLHYGQATNF